MLGGEVDAALHLHGPAFTAGVVDHQIHNSSGSCSLAVELLGDLVRQGGLTHLAGAQQGNGRKAIQLLEHSPLQPPGHQARTGHLTLQIRTLLPVLQG